MIVDFVADALDICNELREDRIWSECEPYVEARKIVLSLTTRLVLYHGTTSRFKDNILSEGIKSRESTGNSTYEGEYWDDLNLHPKESKKERIYIGNYERARRLGEFAVRKFGGKLMVFRVILGMSKLLPDEDSSKRTALESLALTGTCATTKIPFHSILGFYDNIRFIEGYLLQDYHALRSDPREFVVLDYEKMEMVHTPIELCKKRGANNRILEKILKCDTKERLAALIRSG